MGKKKSQERLSMIHADRRVERLEPRNLLAVTPLAGDWDGDGDQTIGFYDSVAGEFLFTNENTSGAPDKKFRFGPRDSNLLPIAGDWNDDGTDSVGLYDPTAGTFNLTNGMAPGPADVVFRFGPKNVEWLPIAGNWNGVNGDGVALYVPKTGRFFLKNDLSPGAADIFFSFGPKNKNWTPLAGDWDGNSVFGVGLHDDNSGKFFLRDTNTSGPADTVVGFGAKGRNWFPLAGDWDGNSTTTFGVQNPATDLFYIKDVLIPGNADATLAIAPVLDTTVEPFLTAKHVSGLLTRAAAASAGEDAIIAIVDRGGKILGVRVEADVLTAIPDDPTRVFAIDGAVAKARTAAFFANDTAPLTSRLIRFISQSTITQREVEANPSSLDPVIRGPGFVAPIGLGGHFPPEIPHTPVVDLFAIEHTNRDSIIHPGRDFIRGTADDVMLPSRFNVDPVFIPVGQGISPPESYGFASGLLPNAQSRGVGTLPGGLPIFKEGKLVGGIGVFFPGPDGYATHEQGFVPGIGQTEAQRTNAPKTLESEWIALAALGGTLDMPIDDLNGVPRVEDISRLPLLSNNTDARLTLVGVELEVVGPHPDGVWTIMEVGQQVLGNEPNAGQSGQDFEVAPGVTALDGAPVPEGWLVAPHGSTVDNLSAADVEQIILNAIAEADLVRAAIRLPSGSRTKMVFSVADTDGNVLALFRMPDATYFSIDVAVAKARNTAYYADALALRNIDQIAGLPKGTAFTNRTFRFVAEPRFPDGVEGTDPSPFSVLNDPGTNRWAENTGAPAPASAHTSVLGFDAFNPGSNFRDPGLIENQNGIVFFPGSTPIYQSTNLVGGFGVSGDGVDQDDVVTFFGAQGFLPPDAVLRADEVFVRTVRLPYIKFLRNPEG